MGGPDVIEDTVTKSAPPTNRRVCLYCGLPSDVSPNHASIGECIDALQREVNRLRDDLHQAKSGAPVVSQRASDRDNARPMSVRLTPAR